MAGAKHKDGKQGTPVAFLEEQNLVEFPLCYLADNAPAGIKTLLFKDEIFDSSKNEKVVREVTITAADVFGLPNWLDQDVLLALMVLANRKNRFQSRTVAFSIYELSKLLGFAHKGQNFKRIALSLDRWCGTTIKYKNAWRKDNRWASETFHIIDRVKLTNSRDYDPEEQQIFEWSSVVLESIQKQNTKPFDWEFYKSLKNPTSKRLYRFLDKRFWKRRKVDFQGVDFAINKLGLADGQRPHRYKERLKSGSKELVKRGFIKEPRFEKAGKGRFRVFFEKVGSRGEKVATVKAEPTELENELLKRGVSNAAELISKHGEKLVREQVENFDDRIRAGEKVAAGWLGSSIARGGYSFRKDYVTKEEREARAKRVAAKRAAKAERERKEEEASNARAKERRDLVEAKLGMMTKSEQEEFFAEALSAAPDFYRSQYRKRVRDKNERAAAEWRQSILEDFVCGKVVEVDSNERV